MGIDKTASDRFFIVSVESKETTESHIVDLQDVCGKHACMCERTELCIGFW